VSKASKNQSAPGTPLRGRSEKSGMLFSVLIFEGLAKNKKSMATAVEIQPDDGLFESKAK